jgi:hypothetical protein
MEGKVMNISKIRTTLEAGTRAQNERSRLVTRSADENPKMTLFDFQRRAETSQMPDPLIQALVDRLPKADTIWSIDDRGKWLQTAALIFNLVYRTGEGEESGFKQESQETPSASKWPPA